MKRWTLQTTQSQIVAVLFAALFTTIALIAALLILSKPDFPPRPPGPWPQALQAAAILQAAHAASPPERKRIAEAVSSEGIRLWVGAAPVCDPIELGFDSRGFRLILDSALSTTVGPFSVVRCADEKNDEMVLVPLPQDDVSLQVMLGPPARSDGFPAFVFVTLPLIVLISFLVVLLVALSLWNFWRLNRPLSVLAASVERFGVDVTVAPLREQGPLEIRRVAKAFNRMQARITRSVAERTQMLIAIGHDLRTPLTRLKLRVETAETPATTELMRDLNLMHKMINGALAFLVGESDKEECEIIDLGALVESICAEFAESGKDVTYLGAYGPACQCQPMAITRAINNVIENGCRYGTKVVVNAGVVGEDAIIEIYDNGPGVPESMREAALLPFSRLDPARPGGGGLGLGLSIVQDIVQRHDGRLSLSDAHPHGLCVRMILPLGTEAEANRPLETGDATRYA